MKKKLSFLGLLFVFTLSLSGTSLAGAKKVVMDGSFVQPKLCGSWTDARWQQEFSAMKEAGMHYLVIGPLAESFSNKKARMLYPSALPNTELARNLNGRDMVDICLRNAESAGIKVFIGIGMNDKWWSGPDSLDSNWLYNQMNFDNKVCDEVWNLYKKKYPTAFYGWYWVYEVANVNLTPIQQDVLINAMNMQLDHLTSRNEKLPFMWCPFMNSKFGTPEAYAAMWKNVFSKLHTSPGDIFAPQDCVGAGGITLNEVPAWFSALRKAVDTKPGLVMWSDVETFDQSDWSSATMDRVIKQMQIEQPYVENYITFAYCHYQSPYNTAPGYQATYVDYLNTGKLESSPPTAPANFSAVLQSNGNVVLNWNESSDNIGVCGYYVFRNGTMVCKKLVPRIDEEKKSVSLTEFVDSNVNKNMTYTYKVQAYDFANNVSDFTRELTITVSPKEK
jgi:hypothetical protein